MNSEKKWDLGHQPQYMLSCSNWERHVTAHIRKMYIQGIKISFGAQERHYPFQEEWQPAVGHKAIVVKSTKLLISPLLPKYYITRSQSTAS